MNKNHIISSLKLNGVLLAVLLVLFFISLIVSYVTIPVADVIAALFGAADEKVNVVVREIRLPRALLAIIVGASLSMSGAALQGFLRNPLAEPGVTGISASAALGAVIALYFGLSAAFPYALPLLSMLGALGATTILYFLAARDASTLTIILAGVAISSFAVALTSLAMNLSPNPWAFSEIAFWLLGSVRNRSFSEVTLALPFVVVGWGVLLSARRGLDALSLGEDVARSLGFNMRHVRLKVILGTTLAVGSSVAVAGTIGFVGLVVPHLMRPFAGHQPSRLMIPSAIGGALLILFSDILVRLVPSGPELHLGVLTAFIGAPFFLYLILKTRREMR